MPNHEDKEKFFSSIKETLRLEKNKEQFQKKENQGLQFYTSSLAISDNSSKMKLIESIDHYINKFKEQNKYKLDMVKKDPKIKALKRMRKMLMENDGVRLINGRKLPEPNDKALKRIQEINSKNIVKRKKSAEPIQKNDKEDKDQLSFCI